jgi:hypothetical protein
MFTAGFMVIVTDIANSTITRVDDPLPAGGDLEVSRGNMTFSYLFFVGKETTITADVYNHAISYASTWHYGDYAEYDFSQNLTETLDIELRVRSTSDPTSTEVHLNGALIGSFNSLPAFDIVTLHDISVVSGSHTIRVTQKSDSPSQGDSVIIDWIKVGNLTIEGELYDRSYGTDSNPSFRGVDMIVPSKLKAKFYVDGVLHWENLDIGSHTNAVPGDSLYSAVDFIPNSGFTNTSIKWTPSTPGFHTISVEVLSGVGGDINISNNIASKTIFVGIPPPKLYINTSLDKKDAVLNWDPPDFPGIDHYLIYRSTSQVNFDFNSVWKNTSIDMEIGELTPTPTRTMWNDTNSADPGNTSNFQKEYYYIIRSVFINDEVSGTSRTVGKWTRTFSEGVSAFSLPLEPMDVLYVDNLTTDMGAQYVKYINNTTSNWMQHDLGQGAQNNIEMRLGEGYEVMFNTKTNYTFCGMPGAMIHYTDATFGFDAHPEIGDARNISIFIGPDDHAVITWEFPQKSNSSISYWLFISDKRDGFWGTPNVDYHEFIRINCGTPGEWIQVMGYNVLQPGDERYYMIVPEDDNTLQRGVGKYSIGIWIEEYLAGYDSLGIPLKTGINETSDWYCDNIPDTIGINYYIHSEQRWSWHVWRMPKGAYDPNLVMAEGYQISTSSLTKFTFIGI